LIVAAATDAALTPSCRRQRLTVAFVFIVVNVAFIVAVSNAVAADAFS
jgi:hypothetical protein